MSIQLPADEASATCQTAAEPLLDAMGKTTDSAILSMLAPAIASLAEHMAPEQAAAVTAAAAQRIVDATRDPNNRIGVANLNPLSEALGKLAEHMKPEHAAAAAVAVSQPILHFPFPSADGTILPIVAPSVDQLSRFMTPEQAAAAGQGIVERIAQRMPSGQDAEVRTLMTFLDHTTPDRAAPVSAAAAQPILDVMAKSINPKIVADLASALAKLCERMTPEQAAATSGAAAQPVLDAIGKSTDPNALKALTQALGQLAQRMTPERAAAVAQPVLGAMAKNNRFTQLALADALGKLVERMTPDQAAATLAAAARTLLDALGQAPDLAALNDLEPALGKLADRMTAEQAGEVAKLALDVLVKTENRVGADFSADQRRPIVQSGLGQALGKLAERMTPEQAAGAAVTVLDAMSKITNLNVVPSLADASGKLAERMTPEQVATAAKPVLDAIAGSSKADVLRSLSPALGKLARRMTPEAAAAAAQPVLDAIAKTNDAFAAGALAEALGKLCERMTTERAAGAAASAAPPILNAMSKTGDPFDLTELATPLGTLCKRMTPEQATAVAARAAPILLGALAKANDAHAMKGLGESLGRLTEFMSRDQTVGLAGPILAAMARTDGPTVALIGAPYSVGEGCRAHESGRSERGHPTHPGRSYQDHGPTRPNSPGAGIWETVRANGARTGRCGRRHGRATIVGLLAKTKDPNGLTELAQVLAVVSAPLTPEDAAAAAKLVFGVLAKTTDLNARNALWRTLGKLVDRMTAEQLAVAARLHLDATDRAIDKNLRSEIRNSLAVVAAKLPVDWLVELLKEPTCVGEVRASILNELGRRVRARVPMAGSRSVTAGRPHNGLPSTVRI